MSFISPAVNQDTMLVFKLTVTDDKGSSDSAITAVKVVNNENGEPECVIECSEYLSFQS